MDGVHDLRLKLDEIHCGWRKADGSPIENHSACLRIVDTLVSDALLTPDRCGPCDVDERGSTSLVVPPGGRVLLWRRTGAGPSLGPTSESREHCD